MTQKCTDLRKPLEQKHESKLSSNDDNIKQATQKDIDNSVEKHLDTNRMNTTNLPHHLLQEGYKEWLPNMMTLLDLAAICPTTTAEVERGFSLMNLICTPLRSSMSHQTLEYITRICLTPELTKEDWDNVADTFIVGSEFVKTTRRLEFGK